MNVTSTSFFRFGYRTSLGSSKFTRSKPIYSFSSFFFRYTLSFLFFQQFTQVSTSVRNWKTTPSNDENLALYSLYKQAVFGDVNIGKNIHFFTCFPLVIIINSLLELDLCSQSRYKPTIYH